MPVGPEVGGGGPAIPGPVAVLPPPRFGPVPAPEPVQLAVVQKFRTMPILSQTRAMAAIDQPLTNFQVFSSVDAEVSWTPGGGWASRQDLTESDMVSLTDTSYGGIEIMVGERIYDTLENDPQLARDIPIERSQFNMEFAAAGAETAFAAHLFVAAYEVGAHVIKGAMAGPIRYEAGWRQVSAPRPDKFDVVQAAALCAGGLCTELVVNGSRANAVFSMTLAAGAGISESRLIGHAAALLGQINTELDLLPTTRTAPAAVVKAEAPEVVALEAGQGFATDTVLSLADAQAFRPGLEFRVTAADVGEAVWTADAGWDFPRAEQGEFMSLAVAEPGILFLVGGNAEHVSVPNVAGLNSQAADFQMRWQEMTVRLSVRVYGVSPATVTDAVRTGRKLPQGWLAAPLSPSPRAANNFAARCLDQICDAFAFNNALNNAVLAIFVEVPNPVPTQTILDFGGGVF